MKKIFFLILFVFMILAFGAQASAASASGFDLGNLGKIDFLPTKVNDAKELMAVIINWLLTFAGALAVIALVYSGIMYITAGADAAKAESAKKNIVWAIVGILIAISALIIVNTISQIFHG